MFDDACFALSLRVLILTLLAHHRNVARAHNPSTPHMIRTCRVLVNCIMLYVSAGSVSILRSLMFIRWAWMHGTSHTIHVGVCVLWSRGARLFSARS